jgi:hypothetical protein
MAIVTVDSINCVGSCLNKNQFLLSGRSPSPDKAKDRYYLFMTYFSKSVRLQRMVGESEIVRMVHYVSCHKHDLYSVKKIMQASKQ